MTHSKEQVPAKKTVEAPSRGVNTLVCPHCWTSQRTDRDFCYRCGAEFHYLDEAPHKKIS